MKKVHKLLIIQIIFAIILLALIFVFFMQRYINYLPYTEVTLENTTILGKVIEALS